MLKPTSLRHLLKQATKLHFVLAVIVVALLALTIWFAVTPSETDALTGQWQPILTQQELISVARIVPGKTADQIQLEIDEDALSVIPEPRRSYVRIQLDRFNSAYQGRNFLSAREPRDCIIELRIDSGKPSGLILKDLAAYNDEPKGEVKLQPMGTVHFRPATQNATVLSDGKLWLFLDPQAEEEITVTDDANGAFRGRQFTFVDAEGLLRAVLSKNEEGNLVIEPKNQFPIYINNQAGVNVFPQVLQPEDLVEIDQRFFEVQLEGNLPIAESTIADQRHQRRYPFGEFVHFVGPVSLDGTFQSVGLEFMFQEYLYGNRQTGRQPGEIWLTLDSHLQIKLANQVMELAQLSGPLDSTNPKRATGMIMNATTGAIVAMAGFPERYNPNDRAAVKDLLYDRRLHRETPGSFKRHVIGSVTKPFFAFLALDAIPDVTHYKVEGWNSDTFFGHKLYDNNKEFVFKRSSITFRDYLVQSDNAYQHTLGLLLLSGQYDFQELPRPWFFRNQENQKILRPTTKTQRPSHLEWASLGQRVNQIRLKGDHPLVNRVQTLFDIQTSASSGGFDRDLTLYDPLLGVAERLLMEEYDKTTLEARRMLEGRSTMCAPEQARMELLELRDTREASILLFGGARNRWTDAKLCEAFSRLITGRRIKAQLIHQFRDPYQPEVIQSGGIFPEKLEVNGYGDAAFSTMRKYLEQVPLTGTAKKLAPMIQTINAEHPNHKFKLFAKTGTLQDVGDENDSKLLLGTFGYWDESVQQFNGKAYTFVFYLKDAREDDAILDLVAKVLPEWLKILKIEPLDQGA